MPQYRVSLTVEGQFVVLANNREEAENLAGQLMDDGLEVAAESLRYQIEAVEEVA
jgi:hypothetical protein